ncbi:hypothetical protein HYC85_004922 [Camellia sinensis]|uniref:ATPase AAA-type core domain-containing protein n=1 Tax=Camellia sinensis TaxID=4442 RepID=A0A7J7HZ72_CAMSI|nr:hypothetical protein HYC85_004922 [Camellia sinensis]
MKYKKETERIDELCWLKQKREELLFSLQEVEMRDDLARVTDLKYVEAAITKLEASTEEGAMLTVTIRPEQIAEIGISMTRLGQNEKERLIGLADRLHQRVVGQDQAVSVVAEVAGLGRPQQATSSFLFLGPTGVGKTELAKALIEQLFDNANLLI